MTSSSGLRGHRRTYLTILESADHALFKMVRYVLLRPLRPEIDGQVPFQTFQTLAKQCEGESIEREKGKVVGRVHLERVKVCTHENN
jgi:hypothetical protein